MSDESKRVQVFPHPSSLALLGIDSAERGIGTELTHAIECWAQSMRRAADEVAKSFNRREWNFLADILNGTHMLDVPWTGRHLAIQAADAQELDAAGDKWFGDGEGKLKVRDLSKRLDALSFEQAQAICLAARWFWAHHEKINVEKDEWWSLPYRLRAQKS